MFIDVHVMFSLCSCKVRENGLIWINYDQFSLSRACSEPFWDASEAHSDGETKARLPDFVPR